MGFRSKNHETSNEILNSLNQGKNATKKSLKASGKVTKTVAKTVKKGIKKLRAKATKEASKGVAKSSAKLASLIPAPVLIVIVCLTIFFFLILCIWSDTPDAVVSYDDKQKEKIYEEYNGYKSGDILENAEDLQSTKSDNDGDASTEDEVNEENIDLGSNETSTETSQKYTHENFSDGEETLSGKSKEELNYTGDDELTSEIALICNDYIAFFKDIFQYVYDNLAINEIQRVVNERHYDSEETLANYEASEEEFMDYINYAEIISVMSQNETLSYENGTMESMREFLKKEETNTKLQNLFSMYAKEEMKTRTLFSKTYTKTEVSSSPTFTRSLNQELLNVTYENVSTTSEGFISALTGLNDSEEITDSNAFLDYCNAHKGENEFKEYGKNYLSNGRTVIQTCDDKPYIQLKTVVSKQYVTEIREKNYVYVDEGEYDDYRDKYDRLSDGRLVSKNGGGFLIEGTDNVYYKITTEYTTTLTEGYLYASFQLIPYCLNGLYDCFEVNKDDYNVSHHTVSNIETLNEQEKFLRLRASDIDFGKETRTEERTPYEALISGLTTIEADEIARSLTTQLHLTDDWQTNIYLSCDSLSNRTYGNSYTSCDSSIGKYSSFVCCSYVYEAFKKIGIEICPARLYSEDISSIGGASSKCLYYSCTLMSYYFRKYQPQACISNFDISSLQVGDIVFMQYDLSSSSKVYGKIPLSEYSDHVYIYLGNGLIGEEAGGTIGRSLIRKIQASYIQKSWFVVRPSLLN